MKKKLLVANRSEIACRIFQAAREMGLKAVAIVAPGDEEARHITYADEVVEVKSYLDIPSIIEACQKAKVSLVHPGYGFLSERPVFARALEKNNIGFLGPRAETMEALGEKIAAKELAEKFGIPTLPWARVPIGGDLKSAASKVGFPLLLKASAGGGGKGMRKVFKNEELDQAAESASAEALSFFGDGTLFLERLVENPRHIEVQAFGDGFGAGVHLYERECSLQRRHQKVWEEARAPNLSEETRKGILESALKLVHGMKYRSAGTLEFLVDSGGSFYFLEMNTRLQVEHPVSELITGVDLVHAQIQLGLEPLQKHLPHVAEPRGHAIEVRLYAEDPAQGFIPTPGKIEYVRWPTGPGIRIDSGIEQGQTITTLFDSMMGKVIVWATTRALAIHRMQEALRDTVVLGTGHNQSYLMALAQDDRVMSGKIDTGYLEREFASKFAAWPLPEILGLSEMVAKPFGAGSSTSSSGAVTYKSPWHGGALI